MRMRIISDKETRMCKSTSKESVKKGMQSLMETEIKIWRSQTRTHPGLIVTAISGGSPVQLITPVETKSCADAC